MGIKRKVKQAIGSDVVLLDAAFDDFIAEKIAKPVVPKTIQNYKQSYGYFVEFNDFDEATTCNEVTQSHIFKWKNTMKIEGISTASINHYLRDVRAFLYWCMDEARVYVEYFPIEEQGGQEEPLKFFSDEELEALLAKPRINDSFAEWRSWAIVSWVLATGNRARTICEVQIGDVDYKENEITLRHTKNKKAQVLPLSPALKTVLQEYCRVWRRGRDNEASLFPNVGDEKLTTNALAHSFARYCHNRGVDHTSIHGLRHNFARDWVRNGGNIFALQRLLGHSTIEMTNRYVNLFGKDLKQNYDVYSPLDKIKKAGRRTQKVQRS